MIRRNALPFFLTLLREKKKRPVAEGDFRSFESFDGAVQVALSGWAKCFDT